MFRKKPQKDIEFQTLGALIVEKVRMPHSLVEADGTEWNIVTIKYRLRMDNGPIFLERTYATGTREDLDKMLPYVSSYREVEHESDALYLFYDQLRQFLGTSNEDLG